MNSPVNRPVQVTMLINGLITRLFTIDPGSVYDMTQDELQHLIGQFMGHKINLAVERPALGDTLEVDVVDVATGAVGEHANKGWLLAISL